MRKAKGKAKRVAVEEEEEHAEEDTSDDGIREVAPPGTRGASRRVTRSFSTGGSSKSGQVH